MNVQQNTKKGFTIIEVVLVLAIAALIFLMIFVALPALQRGQRNTARKNDVGTIASAINTYRSNRGGALPATQAQLATYIDKLSQINSADVRVQAYAAGATFTETAANLDTVTVYTGAACNDATGQPQGTTAAKAAAVVTVVEAGTSTYAAYCQKV